jgi:catechol 2,3-dioxygenase-like lactoylglutathione lyase family enzyme
MPITGLHSFGLTVPDATVADGYYRDFGLRTAERGATLAARCEGRDQDQILISEARHKRLTWVAFSVEPGSLPELSRQVSAAGYARTDGPADGPADGMDGHWFRDPDGLPVLLSEGDQVRPRPYPPLPVNSDGGYPRTDQPRWLQVRDTPGPAPRRLGHVIKYCPDIPAAERFYLGALGLRLADSMSDRLSFWHCGQGDHHIFGVSASPAPGLHHASFEVANGDEIATGASHMAERGHRDQWGLGRHTFGSNLFTYIKDPWGSWTEYFTDIDQVTCAWQGRHWEIAESGSAVWGPPMPADFHRNTEIPGQGER